MNKFEQKLLETGSFELICSYVVEHKKDLSLEFKNAVADKIKIILQVFDFQITYFGSTPIFSESKEDILNMSVESFLRKYGYRPPKRFLEQCQENNLNTARDVYQFGRFNVLKMKNVGKKTIMILEDAFVIAGIPKF